MTAHNLDEHLSWLLQRGPIDYPALPHAPSSTILDEHEAVHLEDEAFISQPVSVGIGESSSRGSAIQTNPFFLHSTEEQQFSDMGRLSFAPRSTAKPRMFSQIDPSRLNSLATSASNPSWSSKGLCEGTASSHGYFKDSSSPRQNRIGDHHSERRPRTNPLFPLSATIKYDFEIDSIDLTGDTEKTTSSSATVEAFGEPLPLWREDSASRAEPLPKGRRKRKSDEYKSDLVSPSRHGIRTRFASPKIQGSQISEGGLGDLHEDVPDYPTLGKSPTRQSQIPGQPLPFLDDLSMPFDVNETIMPTDRTKDISLDSRTSCEFFQPGVSVESSIPLIASQAGTAGHTAPINKPPSRRGQRVVADSDDEDEIDFLQDQEEIPVKDGAHYSQKREILYPDLSPATRCETTTFQRSHKPVLQEFADQPSQTTQKSAFDPQLELYKLPQKPLHEPQSTSLAELNPAQGARVAMFIDVSKRNIDNVLQELRDNRTEKAMTVFQFVAKGQAAPQHVKDQITALSGKLSAWKSLGQEVDEYDSLSTRHKALESEMLAAIAQDVEQAVNSPEADMIRDISEALEAVRIRIYHLLEKVEWNPNAADIRPSSHIENPAQVGETPRRNVLIESTQAHGPRSEPFPRHTVDSTVRTFPQTQPIYQTQFDDLQSSTPRSKDDRRPESRDRVARYLGRGSPAKSIMNEQCYQAPTPPEAHTSIASQASRRRQAQGAAVRDSQFRIDFDAAPSYATTMGTPTRLFLHDDEYDYGADDDDMLEAAENFENGRHPPNVGIQTVSRQVFMEMAANMGKQSTHKKLLQSELRDIQPLMQHPWSKDVKTALKDRFHLRGFRHNQLEAINATLAGKDAFVLMPTGGGKSLCYQLPSVVCSGRTQGVTIVISPLLSLMQDQVAHLKQLRIQAELINSEVTAEHRKLVLDALNGPRAEEFIQLLYVTPEMINNNVTIERALRNLHKGNKLARIVIDEAHCVSQWGHDFRPDYKELGAIRKHYPGIPVMALTATATENVKVDVMHNLGMEGCDVFTQSFNRPNLTYEVRKKGKAADVLNGISDIINASYRRQSGIVYCLSRKNCERLAQELRQKSIKAAYYHAGMESLQRAEVQQKWQKGEIHVIVATIAFGMGIDKPDVRFVIHHTIPKSLEGYYQETGRAGRDGKRSGCYLYYGYQDTSQLKRMIDAGEGSWEQKDRQRQMLRNVIQFCENKSDCRRMQVLAYFNEVFDPKDCDYGCDNCNSKGDSQFQSEDFSDYAASALSLVRQVQSSNVTLLHCVDVFRGAKSRKIIDMGHDSLKEFGMGSDIGRGDVERLFYRLLTEDALREENKPNRRGFAVPYIHLSTNAHEFSSGRRRLQIQVRVSPLGKSDPRRRQGARKGNPEHPTSTNISSPIRKPARRRLVRKATLEDDPDEDEGSNGFEPVRIRSDRVKERSRDFGPPITKDNTLEGLDENHCMVIENFVIAAKEECEKIRSENNLMSVPFTDSMLREMAIKFPRNKAEMLKIEGIDPERVNLYGARFLKRVRGVEIFYNSMMRDEEVIEDPNHRNVVEISSDDEHIDMDAEEYGNFDERDFEMSSEGEQSTFFGADADVRAFNDKMSQTPLMAPSGKGATSSSKGAGSRRRSGNKPRQRQYNKEPKRNSGGVGKKRANTKRASSSGSTGTAATASRRGDVSAARSKAGMELMPA